jgi:hypothetical protein
MPSSPFRDDLGKVHLSLTAGSPLAELFLVDHAFNLVQRSVGRLDAEVEQGVYKVKAQLNDAIAERLVVLNRDQNIDLFDELPIASPVPLPQTETTHEYHLYPAMQESTTVASTVGSGAKIFLCARRWSRRDAAMHVAYGPGPPDLSLHLGDGEGIIDLRRAGRGQLDLEDPMVAATVAVNPGTYFVRWRDESDLTVEQSIAAVEGWQTQVFLLEDARAHAVQRREISVLMARHGFDPQQDEVLRLSEQARAALGGARKVASRLITESLFAKFENPMLGLFGAHLMLIARDATREAEQEERGRHSQAKRLRAPVTFEQTYFDEAVDNLSGLLGASQPDVTALATQSSNRRIDNLEPVTTPPMLWRSWVLLIEASNDRPELLPTSTWRKALRFLPHRPFLAWAPDADSEKTAEAWRQAATPVVQAAMHPERRVTRGVPAAELAPGGGGEAEVRRRLTSRLLAPRAAIDDLAGDLPE